MTGRTVPPALSAGARVVLRGAAAVSALGAGCVALALVWLPQERLVWQPPRTRRGRGDPPGVDRLDYEAADGQPLLAWVMEPPRAPARGTLLAFHGNAELAAWSVPWAAEVAGRTGWRVVLPEYRGYAGLGGTLSHANSQRDADAALAAARDAFGAAGAPLALFGHSLGTAVAAELAARACAEGAAPAAVLLESPFTSTRAMARVASGRALDRLWERTARVRFDTTARVAEVDVPVAVAHGLLDLVVPARMGLAVHAAAARAGELLLVPRASHNDVAERGGERYWRWLVRALGADVDGPRGPADRRSTPRAERLVL